MNVDFVLNYCGFISLFFPSSIYIQTTWKLYYLQCAWVCMSRFFVWKVFFFKKAVSFCYTGESLKFTMEDEAALEISLSRTEEEDDSRHRE